MHVAPDLTERLLRYVPVQMPFHSEGLTPRERRMVAELVAASHYMEDIYWRQSDPKALALYHQLAGSSNPQDQELRRLLFINGSRFDLLDNNQPFVGAEPMPPGRGFYATGLTRENLEQYVQKHPDQKTGIYSGYTIVRRRGNELEAVPYHIAYQSFLTSAARALRNAAALSDDKAFADFLRSRAQALLTDDYYPSDLKWMELKNPKFDVIFGPYETYLDGLLGVKTTYESGILIRNEEESRKLAIYQQYVPEIQEALPLATEDKPSVRGLLTPMEVMDSPFRAGDLNHGYQAVADNLPNDPRIHQAKGTKKIFFKNFMDARLNYIVLPVARRLMDQDQAAQATSDGYMAMVLMHEISHGLGPAYARRNGESKGTVDIREVLGPVYGALEESKADVVGMFGLKWLADKGSISQKQLQEAYAAYVAGIFRTVRFGTAEAHGRGEMMEFNYLSEQSAIRRDASGRYVIDYNRMPQAIASLSKELLEIEATGDRQRAEQWFAKYDQMPSALQQAMTQARDVPVDIYPLFDFPDQVQ
jgi:hypothetical protein